MAHDEIKSLHLYTYLCQKIGSEETIRLRRVAITISDLEMNDVITSGSKGEGLYLKGSDLDLMTIDPVFQVYESDKDVIDKRDPRFVMDTDDTAPCFTKLRFVVLDNEDFFSPSMQDLLEIDRFGKVLFSSELFKTSSLKFCQQSKLEIETKDFKLHGPCFSDPNDEIDIAWAFKCAKWISPAHRWVTRSRGTWPPSETISKIIACGVLFVPVGPKGSVNENVQWRISFSVAEKFLTFSFNHTQLLCYGLLKIVLKDMVEQQEDLKGLLCSYFLKTMLFWLLEESKSSAWRPDTIILCFKACLQRLLYCIQYSTLLHYFTSDNNLFFLRFSSVGKTKLIGVLKAIYQHGTHCSAVSESLYNFPRLINLASCNEYIKEMIEIISPLEKIILKCQFKTVLHHLLHYSRGCLSAGILTLHFVRACTNFHQTKQIQCNANNKQLYYKYKDDLCHLVTGLQSDALSGWMKLASFFYVHKHFLTSLKIINYSLWKCIHEKITISSHFHRLIPNQEQEYMLKLTKQKRRLRTVAKKLIVRWITFTTRSPFIPPELELDVTENPLEIPPIPFAHFLQCLCYYHLHDRTACTHALYQLQQTSLECGKHGYTFPLILVGIATQLIFDTYSARKLFELGVKCNIENAALRLFYHNCHK